MMVKTMANAVAVICNYSLKELNEVKKLRPEALTLKDKDGNVTFKVAVGDKSSITEFGICFADETMGGEPKACLTKTASGVKDVENFVVDNFGLAIVKLKTIEEQIAAAQVSIAEDRASIIACLNPEAPNAETAE